MNSEDKDLDLELLLEERCVHKVIFNSLFYLFIKIYIKFWYYYLILCFVYIQFFFLSRGKLE